MTFTPGARTYWHRHDRRAVLLVVTAGLGRVCPRGERPRGDPGGRRRLGPAGRGALARRFAGHRDDPPAFSIGPTTVARGGRRRRSTRGGVGVSGDDRYERGLGVRREVLGDAHVDRSLQGVSEFARPVQEYVTQNCWGEIWSRPGLDRRTRSLLNLVMLTALNRNHELGVHVRGAVSNGCSKDRDPGGAAAGRGVLRCPGRAGVVPGRRAGARRARRRGGRGRWGRPWVSPSGSSGWVGWAPRWCAGSPRAA